MQLTRYARFVAAVTIFGPPIAIGALCMFIWGDFFTPIDLVLFSIFYALTVFGLTAGFHRLFAHHSFQCRDWFKRFVGICGCMAAEGPITHWVAVHRRHHKTSDTDNDPHSPHHFGKGFLATFRGLWHAHMGWMLNPSAKDVVRFAGDLRDDRLIRQIDRFYFAWVLLGLVAPGVATLAVEQSMLSFCRGLFWGGLFRIVVVQHVTWSINSICHMAGSAPFTTGDESRNNLFCALFSFGEGWHNNHHACPYSARHGFLPWQPDMTYTLLKALERFGVVWNLRVPGPAILTKLRAKAGTRE